METLSEALTKLTVLDENKTVVEVGSIVREKPVVLVFLRHFG